MFVLGYISKLFELHVTDGLEGSEGDFPLSGSTPIMKETNTLHCFRDTPFRVLTNVSLLSAC